MTQPIYEIDLAKQQQRPFNAALDYSPQSRTMPEMRMNPITPSSTPSPPSTYNTHYTTPTYYAPTPTHHVQNPYSTPSHYTHQPHYLPADRQYTIWHGLGGLLSLFKSPFTWCALYFLYHCYQLGAAEQAAKRSHQETHQSAPALPPQ